MPTRISHEGVGKPLLLIDEKTGKTIEGVRAFSFVFDGVSGRVVCMIGLEPATIDVLADETQYKLIDPISGVQRTIASIVWAPDGKGKQEVWKP